MADILIIPDVHGRSYDYHNAAEYISLLRDNLDLFSIMTYRIIDGKTIVFSHAPILQQWIDAANVSNHIPQLCNDLNNLLHTILTNPVPTENRLGYISPYRGGHDAFGSPVWADVREVTDTNLIPTADYSVFAHTRSRRPQIHPHWANLDARQAFLLTT
ncbi:MAG: hypothetical protein K2H35_06200 [Muribaculaceae bacterium]|nr:hypothetical protein [Muribaculaceae bacterium]